MKAYDKIFHLAPYFGRSADTALPIFFLKNSAPMCQSHSTSCLKTSSNRRLDGLDGVLKNNRNLHSCFLPTTCNQQRVVFGCLVTTSWS